MTFLPIVSRELRVSARRAGTYWVRLAVALGAIVVGAVIFAAFLAEPPQQLGRFLFHGLGVLLFIYCLAAGRSWTADCLSQEKREGTLGLLFLTDLQGYDVVLGKLAATSLGGFYALVAVVPVLAVPLLLGGISNSEFWRTVLVLADTFLLSLALGILGSVLSRDLRNAMAANFFLLLCCMAVPPACGLAVTYFLGVFKLELFLPCPLFAYYLCSDANYLRLPAAYWLSVGVIALLAVAAVLLASWVVPHSWQDRPATAGEPGRRERWREWCRRWSFGPPAGAAAFRRRMLEVNAFYWLAGRARLKPMHVWTFLALMACWWLVGWMTSGSLWLETPAGIATALLLNSTLKTWVAIEAGQQLGEDRRTGTLELLLSTPLRVDEILRGQLLALRRQFLLPMLSVLGVNLIFMLANRRPESRPMMPAIWLAGMLLLVTDSWALAWVSMAMALRARNQHRAILGTLLRVLVLPWALGGTVALVLQVWAALAPGSPWSPGWKFYLGLWFGLGLAADLLFGLLARRGLLHRFRQFAVPQLAPMSTHFTTAPALVAPAVPPVLPRTGLRPASAAADPHSGAGKEPPPAPASKSKRKRVRVVCLTLALVAGLVLGVHTRSPISPPPVVVPLTSSSGALRVFPNGLGIAMILPDGSLWRWGQAGPLGSTKAIVPERVGTNCDWARVEASGSRAAGLRTDGTLWEWNSLAQGDPPSQIAPGHTWTSIAVGDLHSVALRTDGTLWAWGNNGLLGLGRGPSTTNLVQVGTDRDWAAVMCKWTSTFALRTDGSLWAWGIAYTYAYGVPRPNRLANPSRVCRETNWVELENGLTVQARNGAGQTWEPLWRLPDPEASVATNCRLLASNTVPAHFATALCDHPRLFEIRPDGTLWERTTSVGLWAAASTPWRRVGKRTDWVSVQGAGGIAVGQTSDGTVWTWGLDPSRDATLSFFGKLRVVQARLRARLTGPPAGSRIAPTPAVQLEPRPLVRLAPPDPGPR